MGEKENKKIVVSFELTLLIVSIFAFSYLISGATEISLIEEEQSNSIISNIKLMGKIISSKLKEPMIPMVSAEPIVGCCELTTEGLPCVTGALQSNCGIGSAFEQDEVCGGDATPFCKTGCCYIEAEGEYGAGALQSDCTAEGAEWDGEDPFCNTPKAYYGCCTLGPILKYITQGQCRIESATEGIEVVDWNPNRGEAECALAAMIQTLGACVLPSGGCSMTLETQCFGDFYEGFLCTAPELETGCEMTDKTTCVPGKDGVYFVDSCGNPANIYDSSEIDDLDDYWTYVKEISDSCGDDFVKGNANSKDCGNCNRFLGGACSFAPDDNFAPDAGDYYCQPTGCMADKNGDGVKEPVADGESWCVYDGKVGDGDDTPGSRHWLQRCNQREITVEPCSDYRNRICVQSDYLDTDGVTVLETSASCLMNTWRGCLPLNAEDDGLEQCELDPQCIIEEVQISSDFNFSVCVPKYPGGFDLTDITEIEKGYCDSATVSCTVPIEFEIGRGCVVKANEACMNESFPQKMNDFCRKLGDCGGEANYKGVYNGNYRLSGEDIPSEQVINLNRKISSGKIKDFDSSWEEELEKLANPVEDQFVNIEDFIEYLGTLGFGSPDDPDGPNIYSDTAHQGMYLGFGVTALAGYIGLVSHAGVSMSLTGLTTFTTGISAIQFAAVSGVVMGAAIGALLGYIAAEALGLEPSAARMLAIAGGVAGAGLMIALMATGASNPWNPIGWISFGLGLLLGIISLFVPECLDYVVEFECKPWMPPPGDNDCELCNGDPMKPCSEYRCSSLGAACEFIYQGDTEERKCIASEDDGLAPVISVFDNGFDDSVYINDVTGSGASLRANAAGDCFESYADVSIRVQTSKHAYCKYSTSAEDFEDMDDFGVNAYTLNHSMWYSTQDPTHGESHGIDWEDSSTFYIKCKDAHETPSIGFFQIDICVKQGPDFSAPEIKSIYPQSGSITGFDTNETSITVYTNELSTCRWDNSSASVEYSEMQNDMTCNGIYGKPTARGYPCTATILTPKAENTYYINCMDQPWLIGTNNESDRNSRTTNEVYTLVKPEAKIVIDYVEPDSDFKRPTSMVTIPLKIKTSLGGDYHFCKYSYVGYENMHSIIEDGRDRIHKISLNAIAGKQHIYTECRDETGDFARDEIEFEIKYDNIPPVVSRVWQDGGRLHIVTNEDAECRYSTETCNFNWENETRMSSGSEQFEYVTSVSKGEIYYIKCKDDFGVVSSDTCSIQVMAV